jgi:hypothetical protein
VLANPRRIYHFPIAGCYRRFQQWRDTYLATYDDYIDKLNPSKDTRSRDVPSLLKPSTAWQRLAEMAQDA